MRAKLLALKIDSQYHKLLAADVRLSMAASLTGAESDAAQAARKLGAAQAERKTFIEHWYGQISQELADTLGKLVEAAAALCQSQSA